MLQNLGGFKISQEPSGIISPQMHSMQVPAAEHFGDRSMIGYHENVPHMHQPDQLPAP